MNRQRNYLQHGKKISKNFFQRAKIIEDPHKETYLSPQLQNSQKSNKKLSD